MGKLFLWLKILNLFPQFYLSWTVAVLIEIHFILLLVRLGFLTSHEKCVIEEDNVYGIRHRV
jgi:hypothetical protein